MKGRRARRGWRRWADIRLPTPWPDPALWGGTARLPRPRRASGAEVLQADPQAATSSAALDIEPDGCPRWPPSGLVRWLERGRLDAVIAGLLFMAGMRRSDVSALRWADVADAADGDGVLVTVRRSKTNQEGETTDVGFVKGGVARAIRTLRAAANPALAVRVVPLSPKMVRLQYTPWRVSCARCGVKGGWQQRVYGGGRRVGGVSGAGDGPDDGEPPAGDSTRRARRPFRRERKRLSSPGRSSRTPEAKSWYSRRLSGI